ncbi:MAG TPA: heavy-metal-associated domain-containing protein [Herpetosiphonaceae bacterium]
MTKAFIVSDMSCGHCAQAITQEVSSVPGVQQVTVDLGTKRVSVEAREDVAAETITSAINEAGYTEITALS